MYGKGDDAKILEVDEFDNKNNLTYNNSHREVNNGTSETSFANNKQLRKSTSGYPSGPRPPRSGAPIGSIQIQQKSGNVSTKNATLQAKPMTAMNKTSG